jgi:RND family efflux transporter MFP subunit
MMPTKVKRTVKATPTNKEKKSRMTAAKKGPIREMEHAMKRLLKHRRKLILAAVALPFVALFAFAALRSGPLAPVAVTTATVESLPIAPALFGIGTVEARYTYRIGPTAAGRVKQVNVQVGEYVRAGQILGEMDSVDLEERIRAQNAALQGAQADIRSARAQLQDAVERKTFAETQARRYDRLFAERVASAEAVETKNQEKDVAGASVLVARAKMDAALNDLERILADREALIQQRANLRLVAPASGLVTVRNADPGSTVLAGQSVVELIDPAGLWVNVRFEQLSASGLRSGLQADIVLRSQSGRSIDGQVLRVEPMADAVTEEILAKVVFSKIPESLPPVGELAEITIAMPERPALPVVPNASVQRIKGRLGVWVIEEHGLRFVFVKPGTHDLDGRMQILEGLKAGQQVVVYSHRSLNSSSRIRVVEHMPGVSS